jgi:hypothetical protein
MVEFERLVGAAGRLIACLHDLDIQRLDKIRTASRTTSGPYRYTDDRCIQYFHERPNQELTKQYLASASLSLTAGCPT